MVRGAREGCCEPLDELAMSEGLPLDGCYRCQNSRATRTKCYSTKHDKHTLSLSHVMYRIFAVAQAGGVVPGRLDR